MNVDKNSIFYGPFWTNLSKFQAFYEILKFNLVILTKFLREIWPFFIFQDLDFFETAYGQIWPFNFFGPGNPGLLALWWRSDGVGYIPLIFLNTKVKERPRNYLPGFDVW